MNPALFQYPQFQLLSDPAKWLYLTLDYYSDKNGLIKYDLETVNFLTSPLQDRDYSGYLKELKNRGLIGVGYVLKKTKKTWWIGIIGLRQVGLANNIDWIVGGLPLNLFDKSDSIPSRFAYFPSVGDTKTNVTDEEIQAIFQEWQDVTGSPRAKLISSRVKAIKRARNDYSQKDVLKAVRNVVLSEFHMGVNPANTKYNDLTTILKKVEHFMELG